MGLKGIRTLRQVVQVATVWTREQHIKTAYLIQFYNCINKYAVLLPSKACILCHIYIYIYIYIYISIYISCGRARGKFSMPFVYLYFMPQDAVGITLFVIGLLSETVADFQTFACRNKYKYKKGILSLPLPQEKKKKKNAVIKTKYGIYIYKGTKYGIYIYSIFCSFINYIYSQCLIFIFKL